MLGGSGGNIYNMPLRVSVFTDVSISQISPDWATCPNGPEHDACWVFGFGIVFPFLSKNYLWSPNN